jgi:hypothetical protein
MGVDWQDMGSFSLNPLFVFFLLMIGTGTKSYKSEPLVAKQFHTGELQILYGWEMGNIRVGYGSIQVEYRKCMGGLLMILPIV